MPASAAASTTAASSTSSGSQARTWRPAAAPDRPEVGQVAGERVQQRVAPAAVDRAHPAQVVVELAALEDVGERELVEGGRAHVGGLLGHRSGSGSAPAATAASRGAARVPAPCSRNPRTPRVAAQALDRADRLAVVAELGVVVVLDDQRAGPRRPVHEGRPAVGREHAARRVLVGGRDDDARRRRAAPAGRPAGRARRPERPRRPGRRAASVARYSGSDGSSTATTPRAARPHRPRGQREALREAAADRRRRPGRRPCRGPG